MPPENDFAQKSETEDRVLAKLLTNGVRYWLDHLSILNLYNLVTTNYECMPMQQNRKKLLMRWVI